MWFFKSWTIYFNILLLIAGIFLDMPDTSKNAIIIVGITNIGLRLKTQYKLELKKDNINE